MMPTLKESLAAGRAVQLFGVGQIPSPKIVEVVGLHRGFDGVWLDVEHGGLSHRELEGLTLAARAGGLDSVARLPATDYASIMRALEAGAGGLIVSMVQSAAHAEQAVRWAKFYPRGERGLNGASVDGGYGLVPVPEYVKRANAQTLIGIQIETRGAIEAAGEIAAIEGVDLLFVGPADLSQVLGVPGDFENPRCLEAIDAIAAACVKSGKPWGIVPRGPEYAKRMYDRGCRFFVTGFDVRILHAGIRGVKEQYAGLFPKE